LRIKKIAERRTIWYGGRLFELTAVASAGSVRVLFGLYARDVTDLLAAAPGGMDVTLDSDEEDARVVAPRRTG